LSNKFRKNRSPKKRNLFLLLKSGTLTEQGCSATTAPAIRLGSSVVEALVTIAFSGFTIDELSGPATAWQRNYGPGHRLHALWYHHDHGWLIFDEERRPRKPDSDARQQHMTNRLGHIMIWAGFAMLTILATAPAWRVMAFGVHPTLDQALLFICSGGR
jgi:hypothetical protein